MHRIFALEALIKIAILLGGLMTAAAYFVLLERWMAAWVQDRIGPNRVGIPLTKIRLFGLGQPLADGLKFIFKEEYTPPHVDKVLYFLAPLAILAAALAVFAVIPFGSVLPRDLGIRRCQQSDPAGRRAGHRRRHDLRLRPLQHRRLRRDPRRLGQQQQIQLSRRPALQRPAHRLRDAAGPGHPRRRAAVRLAATGEDHRRPGRRPARGTCFVQPLGFLVFVIAAFAEAARLPFDLPEGEQELIGGYHTEYAGMKLLLFLIAEFLHMITASFLIVILFLGGWHFWGLTGSGDEIGWVTAILRILVLMAKILAVICSSCWSAGAGRGSASIS